MTRIELRVVIERNDKDEADQIASYYYQVGESAGTYIEELVNETTDD